MTTAVDDWLRLDPSPGSAERRFRVLAYLGVGLFAVYLAATVAGAPASTLGIVFSFLVVPVPAAAWWAYAMSQGQLRRPILLLASAATLWLLGALVWQGFDIANGNKVPAEPGVWDALFVTARLLVIAALVVALRSLISFRLAVLDAIVVIAAGLAIGAPFVHVGLEHGATAATVFTLNLPLLSIVTLMLVASAVLGSWEGIPRSLAMLGLAEIPLMVGNLIYGYKAVQETYDDDRWADLSWAAGAIMVMLAASVIVLGIDRPARLPARPRIPDQPPGARSVLLLSLGALSLSLGVATYGLLVESRGLSRWSGSSQAWRSLSRWRFARVTQCEPLKWHMRDSIGRSSRPNARRTNSHSQTTRSVRPTLRSAQRRSPLLKP